LRGEPDTSRGHAAVDRSRFPWRRINPGILRQSQMTCHWRLEKVDFRINIRFLKIVFPATRQRRRIYRASVFRWHSTRIEPASDVDSSGLVFTGGAPARSISSKRKPSISRTGPCGSAGGCDGVVSGVTGHGSRLLFSPLNYQLIGYRRWGLAEGGTRPTIYRHRRSDQENWNAQGRGRGRQSLNAVTVSTAVESNRSLHNV